MARALVVEGEAVAVVANPNLSTVETGPVGRLLTIGWHIRLWHFSQLGGKIVVSGPQRPVGRQHMLYVHEQQLLVLLLMVEAQLHQLGGGIV